MKIFENKKIRVLFEYEAVSLQSIDSQKILLFIKNKVGDSVSNTSLSLVSAELVELTGDEFLKLILSEESDLHNAVHIEGESELFIKSSFATKAINLNRLCYTAEINSLKKDIERLEYHLKQTRP